MVKKKKDKKNTINYDIWRLLQMLFLTGIVISLTLIILELTKPLELENNRVDLVDPNLIKSAGASERNTLFSSGTDGIFMRPGLFKSETQLSNKPMADKTIQTIMSRLTLQCIFRDGDEFIGYVKIQGEGLEKCSIGETVCDLFTVLNI